MPHTASQIKQIITREKFAYYCLQNAAGESVIPWNTNKPGDSAHLKKILSNLDKSSSLPDGVYYVITAQSKHPKAVKMKYDILRGAAAAVETSAAVESFTGRSVQGSGLQLPAGYSFNDLLKLERELGELRAAVAAKDAAYTELQKDYEELEDELAQAESKEADAPAGGLGSGMAEMAQHVAMFKSLLMPESAPGMSEPAPARQAVTYEIILKVLKENPAAAEKLFNELTEYYATLTQVETPGAASSEHATAAD